MSCEICGKPARHGIGNALHAEHFYCEEHLGGVKAISSTSVSNTDVTEKTCEWKFNIDNRGYSIFSTQCGCVYQNANYYSSFIYCYHCGKKIKEVQPLLTTPSRD